MSQASALRLLLLSMIWGASFVFYKIAAVDMAPTLMAALRVMFGALFLGGLFALTHKKTQVVKRWKLIAAIAVFASALPFTLVAYASLTVTASVLVIINATAPIWAALVALIWTRAVPSPMAILGLLLGLAGVGIIVGLDTTTLNTEGTGLGIAAALGAAACYGIATNMAKYLGSDIDPLTNAFGCLLLGSFILLPFVPFSLPAQMPAVSSWLAILGVGVLCSGVAYLLYFRLVMDIGPTSALTVTFLTPVFGVLWGNLFLDETVGWHTLIGGVVVLAGTALAAMYGLQKPVPVSQIATPD
ncbi:DMT family transporter [Limnobacter parvus]|uniref:DMT family transporter n=1 Tax=Limnobacter parvus TaxID=2939690 RepID=A0ABT1XLS7_9BURK|nr:DMT family transporter [Limnobacter parvus]MCR2747834.1 DMT family transporter [Limnobacter parvus]